MVRLPEPLQFEWDDGNKDKNWLSHQVRYTEVEGAFFDPHKRLARDVLHSTGGKIRLILLVKTRQERLLFIVFTIRGKSIRVISARDVGKKERPLYEESN